MSFLEKFFEGLTEPILGLESKRHRKEVLLQQINAEKFKLKLLLLPPLQLRKIISFGKKTKQIHPIPASVAIPILGKKLYDELMSQPLPQIKLAGDKSGGAAGVAIGAISEILGVAGEVEGPLAIVPQPMDVVSMMDEGKLAEELQDLRKKYSQLVRVKQVTERERAVADALDRWNRYRTDETELFRDRSGQPLGRGFQEFKERLRQYAMGQGNMAEVEAYINQYEQGLFELHFNNDPEKMKQYERWKAEYIRQINKYGREEEEADARSAVQSIVYSGRGRPKKGERFVKSTTIRGIVRRLLTQKNAVIQLGKGGSDIFDRAMKDNPSLWVDILARIHLLIRTKHPEINVEELLVNAKGKADVDYILKLILESTSGEQLRQLNDSVIRHILDKGRLSDAEKKQLEDNIVGRPITPEPDEKVEDILNEQVFGPLNSRVFERFVEMGMDSMEAQQAALDLIIMFRKMTTSEIAKAGGVRRGVDETIGRIVSQLDYLQEMVDQVRARTDNTPVIDRLRTIIENLFGAITIWREAREEVVDNLRTPQGIYDSLNQLRKDIEKAIEEVKGTRASLPPSGGDVKEEKGERDEKTPSQEDINRMIDELPKYDDSKKQSELTDEELILLSERLIQQSTAETARGLIVMRNIPRRQASEDAIRDLEEKGEIVNDDIQLELPPQEGRPRRFVSLRRIAKIMWRVIGYVATMSWLYGILRYIWDGGDSPTGDTPPIPPPEPPEPPTPGPTPSPTPDPDPSVIPDDDPHSFVETPPSTGTIASTVVDPAENELFVSTEEEKKEEDQQFIKFSIVPPLNDGLRNPLIFDNFMSQNKRFTNTYPNPKVPPTKYVDIPRNKQPVFQDIHFDVFDRRKPSLTQRQDGGYTECGFTPVTPQDPMLQNYAHSNYYPDQAIIGSTRQPYYGNTLTWKKNDGADRFSAKDPFYEGGYVNQRNVEKQLYKSKKYNFNIDSFYSVRGQLRR